MPAAVTAAVWKSSWKFASLLWPSELFAVGMPGPNTSTKSSQNGSPFPVTTWMRLPTLASDSESDIIRKSLSEPRPGNYAEKLQGKRSQHPV